MVNITAEQNTLIITEINEKLAGDIRELASLITAAGNSNLGAVERLTGKILGVAQVRDAWEKALSGAGSARAALGETQRVIAAYHRATVENEVYREHEHAGRRLANDHMLGILNSLSRPTVAA